MVDAHQFLQDRLGGIVLRMSLAGENELHRPLGVIDHLQEPFEVGEQKVPPLISGDAAGKTDGQDVGRE